MTTARFAWVLLLGDAAALLAFVLLGMRTHETLGQANALLRLAATAGPLLLTWLAAAAALGAWRFALPLRWRAVWGRTALAWLAAAPLGLLLRAVLLGSATVVVAFALVTLGLGGALLLGWRSLALWLAYGRSPRGPRRPALGKA
jgi:hypothetical protein